MLYEVITEQRPGGGVEIDADVVDAALDDGVEGLLQRRLADVVLVLADADALRITSYNVCYTKLLRASMVAR